MIADDEYIQLYALYKQLLDDTMSAGEKRIVLYEPDLFIEMAKEILKLRRRVQQLQKLDLEYQIKADECIKLCDKINSVRSECRERHIRLNTDLNIHTWNRSDP